VGAFVGLAQLEQRPAISGVELQRRLQVVLGFAIALLGEQRSREAVMSVRIVRIQLDQPAVGLLGLREAAGLFQREPESVEGFPVVAILLEGRAQQRDAIVVAARLLVVPGELQEHRGGDGMRGAESFQGRAGAVEIPPVGLDLRQRERHALVLLLVLDQAAVDRLRLLQALVLLVPLRASAHQDLCEKTAAFDVARIGAQGPPHFLLRGVVLVERRVEIGQLDAQVG
jgi:hypothetical protein